MTQRGLVAFSPRACDAMEDGLGQWVELATALVGVGTTVYAAKLQGRQQKKAQELEKKQAEQEAKAKAQAAEDEKKAAAAAEARTAQRLMLEQQARLTEAQAGALRSAQTAAALQRLGGPVLVGGILLFAAWSVFGRKR